MRAVLFAIAFLLSSSLCAGAQAGCTNPASLPFTFVNGTIADANQANANFNVILNCSAVTANTVSIGGGANPLVSLSVDSLGKLNSSGPVLVANNFSVTVQGAGAFQLGGLNGPVIYNDTALDTISMIAQPGAGPSGDTSNFQVYAPAPGQKAFFSATRRATGGNEERLILGTQGDGNAYLLSQVILGSGVCSNVVFSDGGPTEAFTLGCHVGSGPPEFRLGFRSGSGGVPITSATPSNGVQALIQLDNSLNLIVGAGTNIGAVVTNKSVFLTALGTSGGGGGLPVCVDTNGLLYKKSPC